jgi:hypothetical protein
MPRCGGATRRRVRRRGRRRKAGSSRTASKLASTSSAYIQADFSPFARSSSANASRVWPSDKRSLAAEGEEAHGGESIPSPAAGAWPPRFNRRDARRPLDARSGRRQWRSVAPPWSPEGWAAGIPARPLRRYRKVRRHRNHEPPKLLIEQQQESVRVARDLWRALRSSQSARCTGARPVKCRKYFPAGS